MVNGGWEKEAKPMAKMRGREGRRDEEKEEEGGEGGGELSSWLLCSSLLLLCGFFACDSIKEQNPGQCHHPTPPNSSFRTLPPQSASVAGSLVTSRHTRGYCQPELHSSACWIASSGSFFFLILFYL